MISRKFPILWRLEMPCSGAFFTWTNKTLWSKIDRVFINSLWHKEFDYTLAKYLPRGLFDHTPILLQSHKSMRPPPQFQFCDMWCSFKDFQDIVSAGLPDIRCHNILKQAWAYFVQLRRKLSQLNRSRFADIRGQQETARAALLHL